MTRSISLAILTCGLAAQAEAKGFVVPHFIESKGSITMTPNTFDTTLYMVYTGNGGLIGQGGNGGEGGSRQTDIHVYLFDPRGVPLQSGIRKDVCNPCTYSIGGSQPKLTIRLEDEVLAKGGFDRGGQVEGYAIIVAPGDINGDGIALHVELGSSDATGGVNRMPGDWRLQK